MHGFECFGESSRNEGVSQSLQDSKKELIAAIDWCVNTGANDAAAFLPLFSFRPSPVSIAYA